MGGGTQCTDLLTECFPFLVQISVIDTYNPRIKYPYFQTIYHLLHISTMAHLMLQCTKDSSHRYNKIQVDEDSPRQFHHVLYSRDT